MRDTRAVTVLEVEYAASLDFGGISTDTVLAFSRLHEQSAAATADVMASLCSPRGEGLGCARLGDIFDNRTTSLMSHDWQ